MLTNLVKVSVLVLFIAGCGVSSPTANDVKTATNEMFGALGISVVSIEDLNCSPASDGTSFNCKYTTTMNDDSVLKSEGVFAFQNGAWVRTD